MILLAAQSVPLQAQDANEPVEPVPVAQSTQDANAVPVTTEALEIEDTAADKPDATLPTVTIEPVEDNKAPSAAPKKASKPQVAAEVEACLRRSRPKKSKPQKQASLQIRNLRRPRCRPLRRIESTSREPDLASIGETTATSVLGGPSGIDGYTAKQTTTATKTGTPLKDIPQAISIVTNRRPATGAARASGKRSLSSRRQCRARRRSQRPDHHSGSADDRGLLRQRSARRCRVLSGSL